MPFARCVELCSDLEYLQEPEKPRCFRNRTAGPTLPDAPRIHLNTLSSIVHYCLEDLDTPQLNRLGDKLCWVCTHCVWIEGIIYLKPLPTYLSSYAFWEYLCDTGVEGAGLEERERLRATSLGFVRSYARLIQRRSDFNLAR